MLGGRVRGLARARWHDMVSCIVNSGQIYANGVVWSLTAFGHTSHLSVLLRAF